MKFKIPKFNEIRTKNYEILIKVVRKINFERIELLTYVTILMYFFSLNYPLFL